MTPEQLKASILQRAMEGKLVPQDPNDEPASELLKRIKKEKEKLIKEGKIKRDKNETEIFRSDDGLYYEKFKDGTIKQVEVPFEIPSSWEWVRLGNLSALITDGTHKTPTYTENGIPFLSVQNISSGNFSFEKLKYISEHEHLQLKKRVLPKKDDILFCRIGTLGKAIKNTIEFEYSIFVSLGLIRLIDSSLVDFIIKVINSPIGERWIDKIKVGGGTHTFKINLRDVPSLLVPLPPKEEQLRIFSFMNENYTPLIIHYENAYSKLEKLNKEFPEKLRKSILQYAMQGKLVPQDPDDEPVEVLLEKIRAEKKKLYNEGKIKKKDLEESIIYKGDDNSYYEKNTGIAKEIELDFEKPSTWLLCKFSDCFVSLSTKSFQIKQSEIKQMGTYPVVSQSAKKIEGYSDNSDKVIKHSNPLIIFGDHTRNVKLVDFDFIVGADGVKVIQPILLTEVFAFMAIQNILTYVKNRGYARHYSYLQDKILAIPPTNEQKRITKKVDLYFQLVARLTLSAEL